MVYPDRDMLRSHLHQHLQVLVRDRNPYLASQNHFFVEQYLREALSMAGPVEVHPFEVRGQIYRNCMVKIAGRHPRRPPILVGAHYDTVPGSPGADDNASGVAVLLELARFFAAHTPRSPLWLVGFDLEEAGLMGSAALAEDLRRQGQPLRLMMALEMLGYCDPRPATQSYPPGLKYLYPSTGDFIGLIGSWQLIPVLVGLRRRMRQVGVACEWLPMVNRGQPVPDTRRSDHAPFWDAGYRALMVTDTADMRNPHYHQPSDTLDTLDIDFLTGVCLGLMVGLERL